MSRVHVLQEPIRSGTVVDDVIEGSERLSELALSPELQLRRAHPAQTLLDLRLGPRPPLLGE